MTKKDEFTLMRAELHNSYKDNFLIILSNLNAVHIKQKKKSEIEEGLAEKESFLEKINELRSNLDTLFKRLNLNETHLLGLKVTKSERIEFTVRNLSELINHLLEEIDFYNNRVIELQKYIAKGTIEFENLELLRVCHKNLEKLTITKKDIGSLKQFRFRVFTTFSKNLNNLKNLFEFTEFPSLYETFKISGDRIGFYIIYPKDKEDEFNGRIHLIHSEEVLILKKYLTDEGPNFKRIDKEISFIENLLSRYNKELHRLTDDNLLKFAGINETVQNIEEYSWAEQQFVKMAKDRIYLKFFVPISKKEEIQNILFKIFKDEIILQTIDISKKRPSYDTTALKRVSEKSKIKKSSQVKNKEDLRKTEEEEEEEKEDLRDKTPTVMKNFFLARPFETITKMYGTPNYSEIDPTPIIAITFPILFGLMFGDIGHGIVLIISGLIGAYKFRKREGDIVNFCWIIFYCGIASTFVGFLYGEFLGHNEIEIFGNVILELKPIQIPILNITLYNPLENIMSVFKFAVLIGVFHINLGWFVQFLNYWKQKRKYLGLSDSLMKIFLLTGGTILIFGYGFDISVWVTPPYPILLTIIPGFLILLLKPFGKIFKLSYLQEESVGSLLGEGSMEAFDTVLSVMSNVASYIRLLALALAHIALLLSINAMMGLVEGEGITVMILHFIGGIFGNMIVILLEGLLVFLNCIRLHFYEFFFKFYQGSGLEYIPFVLESNYSVLNFRIGIEKDIISEEIDKEIDTKSLKEEINKAIDYVSQKFK
ncbi:hypothetical protein LCGC14_1050940 [marine sediment metagenome]|uniref:V-type ATP synthase subunit I n=1 Tax=marine sediment metagenome TaxID=412755 RepID=A0A0F9NAP5_9ZZZZ